MSINLLVRRPRRAPRASGSSLLPGALDILRPARISMCQHLLRRFFALRKKQYVSALVA